MIEIKEEQYMQRCLQLAGKGIGNVAPNPMVGAVLVYEGRIIGEGYHQEYGKAHAEVNCLASVEDADRALIADSTLYVSLEPCAHYGKTPPCTELIIRHGIKKVVVATRDPFNKVNGKGIEKLVDAGVSVITGVCEEEAKLLNKRFFLFHTQRRPYIILKWACSSNNALAAADKKPVAISSAITNRLVHTWRAEESAILIGANTALIDNPSLTVRWAYGKNPVRLVIDPHLKVPATHRLYAAEAPTFIYNYQEDGMLQYAHLVKLRKEQPLLEQILEDAYQRQLLSILVEGGTYTHEQFLLANYWDEVRQIRSVHMVLENGYPAPVLKNTVITKQYQLGTDEISVFGPTFAR